MPYTLRYDDTPRARQEAPLFSDDAAGQAEPAAPTETIYVLMTTKDPQRHIRWSRVGDVMTVCVATMLLLAFAVSPQGAVYISKTLVVPAILLPVQTVTATVPIKDTGVTTHPAQAAHGTLTVTNGGSLTQYIPAGFLLLSASGVEIATTEGVTVPAGNGVQYGVAQASAYALTAGSGGNIPAYGVDRTYGTDIFVKNLAAFTGGKDAYTVRYATAQDKKAARASANAQVKAKQPVALLLRPCTETTSDNGTQVSVTRICQPITYHIPAGLHVTGIRVQGATVVLMYRTLAGVGAAP